VWRESDRRMNVVCRMRMGHRLISGVFCEVLMGFLAAL